MRLIEEPMENSRASEVLTGLLNYFQFHILGNNNARNESGSNKINSSILKFLTLFRCFTDFCVLVDWDQQERPPTVPESPVSITPYNGKTGSCHPA